MWYPIALWGFVQAGMCGASEIHAKALQPKLPMLPAMRGVYSAA